MNRLAVAAALVMAVAACRKSDDPPASAVPGPDSVSVTALNYDATAYRLVVQTWDSSFFPPAIVEQLIADPLSAADMAGPGGAGAWISLAPSSATLRHYFAIRDPSTGALLAVSLEYLKGPGTQAVVLAVSGQAVTVVP